MPQDETYEMSDRGFKHYPEIVTSRGEKVNVYESSTDDDAHLWVSVAGRGFLSGPVDHSKDHLGGYGYGRAPAIVAAHLTLADAVDLIERLQAGIANHYQTGGVQKSYSDNAPYPATPNDGVLGAP